MRRSSDGSKKKLFETAGSAGCFIIMLCLLCIAVFCSGCRQAAEDPGSTAAAAGSGPAVEAIPAGELAQRQEAVPEPASASDPAAAVPAPENTAAAAETVAEETAAAAENADTDASETETETEAAPETAVAATDAAAKADWVSYMPAAAQCSQMIVVKASGSSAVLSMHSCGDGGIWQEELHCSAQIGANGIGKTQEGDRKTPRGTYGFLFAFGTEPDPGCALPYTRVDGTYYWVDDSNSAYYNQFVTTNTVTQDWSSAEHLVSAGSSYRYVLALDYNAACVPGAGSAIFLRCQPTGGSGCIAVAEADMLNILRRIRPGCLICIDAAENFAGSKAAAAAGE